MHLFHIAITLIGIAPEMIEMMAAGLVIVDLEAANDFDLYIRNAAVSEGLVGLFRRQHNQILMNIGIVAGCLRCVTHQHADFDQFVPGLRRVCCRDLGIDAFRSRLRDRSEGGIF